MLKSFAPLALFLVVSVFLYVGLDLNPREIPSPFINKPAPQFELPQLHQRDATFSAKDMLGKVWLLNVWASWCVACRQEHPLLVQMARMGEIPVYGLNYKDAPTDAVQWLEQHGDPYVLSAIDFEGKVGIDYGVYGVPETFIIDKKGIIRHKVIGPLTTTELRDVVMPLFKELQGEAS